MAYSPVNLRKESRTFCCTFPSCVMPFTSPLFFPQTIRKEGVSRLYETQAVFSRKSTTSILSPSTTGSFTVTLHRSMLSLRNGANGIACIFFRFMPSPPYRKSSRLTQTPFFASSAGVCGFAVNPKYSLAQPYTTESSMTAQFPSFCLEA